MGFSCVRKQIRSQCKKCKADKDESMHPDLEELRILHVLVHETESHGEEKKEAGAIIGVQSIVLFVFIYFTETHPVAQAKL